MRSAPRTEGRRSRSRRSRRHADGRSDPAEPRPTDATVRERAARSWPPRGSAAAAPPVRVQCASTPPRWPRARPAPARRTSRRACAGTCRSTPRPAGRRRTRNSRRSRRRCRTAPARCRPDGGPAPGREPCRRSGRSIRRPWPASSSPRAHPARRCCPRTATGEEFRRAAGFRLGVALDPDLDPAFDLVERAPERAAVLLGMSVSLVALTPDSPSATRVTERYQSWL